MVIDSLAVAPADSPSSRPPAAAAVPTILAPVLASGGRLTPGMSTLTIRMMVKLGPWMFLGIDDKGFDQSKWEHCEIEDCGEHIRYVHVVEREDAPKQWRIGSTCGPKLIEISEEIWGRVAKEAARNLKLLYRAERMKELEAGPNAVAVQHLGPNWVDPMIAVLKSGNVHGRTLTFKVYAPVNDLKIIQLRLRHAETLHALKPIKMGRGK